MKRWAHRKNTGQATIEAVLILVVLLGVSALVAREFRSNEFFVNLVSGPWKKLDGMIQNGVWAEAKNSYGMHPNHMERHASIRGEPPR